MLYEDTPDDRDIYEGSHLEFGAQESTPCREERAWLKWIKAVERDLTMYYNLAASEGVWFNADGNGYHDGWSLDEFFQWFEEGVSAQDAVKRMMPRFTVNSLGSLRPLSFRTYARAVEALERARRQGILASLHINSDLNLPW